MTRSKLPQRAPTASAAIEALIKENGRLTKAKLAWQNRAIVVVSACCIILIGAVWAVERRNDEQQAVMRAIAINLAEVERQVSRVERIQSDLDPALFSDTIQVMHKMLEHDGLFKEELQALEQRLDRMRATL